MNKRLLSLILAVCLLAGMLPMSVGAAENRTVVVSGYCGEEVWTDAAYTLYSDGELHITGTGPIRFLHDQEKEYRPSFLRIVIEEGITEIKEVSFCRLQNLVSVWLPNSLKSIGGFAFGLCSSLKTIRLPSGLTSIGRQAFSGCSSLSEITLPASLTSLGGYCFDGCSSLRNISIPDGITSLYTFTFANCSSLTEMTLPDSITSIDERAFTGCTSLRSIHLPASLTLMGNECFSRCSSLTKITIPRACTDIPSMAFRDCTSLREVTLSKTLSSVQSDAFSNCPALSDVYYAATRADRDKMTFEMGNNDLLDARWHYLEDGTQDCLLTLTVGENGSAVCPERSVTGETVRVACFPDGGYRLETITVDGEPIEGTEFTATGDHQIAVSFAKIPEEPDDPGEPDPEDPDPQDPSPDVDEIRWSIDENGVFTLWGTGDLNGSLAYFTKPEGGRVDVSVVTEAVIHEGITGLGGLFDGCTHLKRVTLPSTLRTLGNSTFQNCSSLQEIQIPEGVTSFGWSVFQGCSSLTNVTLPNTLKTMSFSVFADCTSLTSITIPDSVTSMGEACFGSCTKLKTITLSKSLTRIEGALFRNCTSLKTVTLPDGITAIKDAVFTDCTALERINITAGVTSIGFIAFAGCSSLREIELPAGVTSIGNWAFSKCTSLAKAGLGRSLTTIPDGCFIECASLKSVEIPATVTSIESGAFMECSSLKGVTLPQGLKELATFAFCDTGLQEVAIPSSLASIPQGAFGSAPLRRISFTPGTTAIGVGAFADIPKAVDIYYQGTRELRDRTMTFAANNTNLINGTWHFIENGTPYEDIKPNSYYVPAVIWAVSIGITSGTDAGHFSPSEVCRRGQVVTFLWRAAGCPEPKSLKNPFSDVKESAYYYKAVLWAVEQNITSGTGKTTFSPDAACERCQVATFLWRAAGKPSPRDRAGAFTDLRKDKYYYDAVLWAVEQGITNGTSKTTFAPNNICLREQVVTFLWRNAGEP